MQKEINVLNIRFNNVSIEESIDFIFKQLEKGEKGYICTPNPEMLLEAENNHKFKDVLNDSLLNIPDGIGILWAATQIAEKNPKIKAFYTLPLIALTPNIFKKVLKERVTGTDLTQKIAERAAQTGRKLFLLGAAPGIAEKTAKILKQRYSGLKIVGTFAGSPSPQDEEEIINKINKAEPAILFVAYGAPAQETWIAKNLKHLKTVKIAIGIGGAFDFITGKRIRAPKWMQKLGIEWLYRLIQEPSRWKRIYNATIKFPFRVIKNL
jgi:N-acetylglucosaminyldiphosphoundecaprenol N-acetyl-beta-D-mannosaminyltransferase